ncbi:peptidylprolyl isomerase [Roseomonas xinghualingensis]|uniref:peptidylprolyl isomerase n=1 Tax=Roseomonas xinghualingensis TaxID=2986475 RepID=UPI0021F1E7F7|nr:peptidylprolyl isomerase [Roseomonas sp. SXEYE001]MCV4207827.1 peptidylprolyl isomerase [Roseomonas sp. SXEYE001]
MRRLLLSTALVPALLVSASLAHAQAPANRAPATQAPAVQTPAAPAAGASAQPANPQPADPVVARVDGQEIRLSDVREAANQLPDELKNAPPAMIYPLILDQLVAQKALVARARTQGLERDPEVQRRIAQVTDQELQQALLRREVAPALTDEALRKRYEASAANRQGEEEVHARHILVPSEAAAREALEEVRRPGADFAEVAKRRSTGPGAQQGGDLGFFKKSDMIPEFSEAAFALQPGQISEKPVQTPFGWHVIKVEGRRTAPPASFEESKEQLRQAAFEEAVNAAVERIRGEAKVERFNMDGSPQRAPSLMDGASPPATPAPAPAQRR